MPEKPSPPRIKAQDKKCVTLEWARVPADSGIKYFVIEKQEQFLVPKLAEDEQESEKETGGAEEGDAVPEKRPLLKTGPSFTGEFQAS